MVATVDLTTKLDLTKIAHNARFAEYNPKSFAAVIMRLANPKTTALVFQSGKMVDLAFLVLLVCLLGLHRSEITERHPAGSQEVRKDHFEDRF